MDDIEQLITLRCLQLQDEGQKPDVNIERELRNYFKEKMESGELVEWVAEEDDRRIIATAAVAFMDFPPTFTNPSGKKDISPICTRLTNTEVMVLPEPC